PKSRNAKTPSTTRKPISITAKTGLFTHTSARVIGYLSRYLDRCPFLQFAAPVRQRENIAFADPLGDLDLAPAPLPDFHFLPLNSSTIDEQYFINAVGILNRLL